MFGERRWITLSPPWCAIRSDNQNFPMLFRDAGTDNDKCRSCDCCRGYPSAETWTLRVGLLLSPPVRAAIPETICGMAVSWCNTLISMPATTRVVVVFVMMVFVPVLTQFSALPRGLRMRRTWQLGRRR